MKYILLFVCYFALQLNAGDVPEIERCLWSDHKCVLRSSKKVLPLMLQGNLDRGIPAASPILIDSVTADTEEFKLLFKNIKVVGLEKCELKKVTRDGVKSTVSLVVETPITATGQYLLNGKLGILNVEGDGDFKINTDLIRFSVEVDLKLVEKKGKKYYKLSKFDYNYEPVERFYINLDNLYNGDKKKAEPLLEILNLSWKDLISTVGKPVIDALITKEFNIVNKFFQSYPADEIEIVS